MNTAPNTKCSYFKPFSTISEKNVNLTSLISGHIIILIFGRIPDIREGRRIFLFNIWILPTYLLRRWSIFFLSPKFYHPFAHIKSGQNKGLGPYYGGRGKPYTWYNDKYLSSVVLRFCELDRWMNGQSSFTSKVIEHFRSGKRAREKNIWK